MAEHIPVEARTLRQAVGRVRAARPEHRGANEGRRAVVELIQGWKSLGYHSKYIPVECQWVKITVYRSDRADANGRLPADQFVIRFTGQRVGLAAGEFERARRNLAEGVF